MAHPHLTHDDFTHSPHYDNVARGPNSYCIRSKANCNSTLTPNVHCIAPNPVNYIHNDLHSYGSEIVCVLEDAKRQRDCLNAQICNDVEQKAKLLKELASIDEKLKCLNEGLICKVEARNQYDSTIKQTEDAYCKIVNSSHGLVDVLKKEAYKMSELCSGTRCQYGPYATANCRR